MSYKELHKAAKEFIIKRLKKKGHKVSTEYRAGTKRRYVIFDVYDHTTDTAYEVLTAKIVVSAHEQPEAFVAKMFRYLLHCKNLRFILASFDTEEIPMFHTMGIEHWHIHDSWWRIGKLKGFVRHTGSSARTVARQIYKAMIKFAPLKEWTQENRRKRHKYPMPPRLDKLTAKLGLPKNFLKGMWRDWRLNWVWKLEKILPAWAKKYG